MSSIAGWPERIAAAYAWGVYTVRFAVLAFFVGAFATGTLLTADVSLLAAIIAGGGLALLVAYANA